jgi:hypothetical protein
MTILKIGVLGQMATPFEPSSEVCAMRSTAIKWLGISLAWALVMPKASAQTKQVEVIIRHVDCVKVTANEQSVIGPPADELYAFVAVKTPSGLIGPIKAPAGNHGPYRIPEKPRPDEYWQFTSGWHSDKKGFVGVDNFKHGTPSVLSADIPAGESVDFAVVFMEQEGKLQLGGLTLQYKDGKIGIKDIDIKKGEHEIIGSMNGRITNVKGQIKVVWKADKDAVDTSADNVKRMPGASPHAAHFSFSGAGSHYNMGMDLRTK